MDSLLPRHDVAHSRLIGAALVLLFIAVYILPLGIRPVGGPDEFRYGEIAHEMLASGDWVSPRFNGVRYFEKPVLGYWLIASSFKVFGENAFAMRLPSALATGLTALLLFGFMGRFAGRRAAYLASAVYCTSLLVVGIGNVAILDSYLTLFLTAALASLYLALASADAGRRRAWLAACGVACAGAFLVKGFLALAIPVVVVAPYFLLTRNWRNLLRTPWLPIGVAVAVVAPWAVQIALREPDYWHYFFWIEHVNRFLGGEEAQHSQPFWFFLEYGPLVALPWVVLAPAAFSGLKRAELEPGFLRYVILWAVLPFLFFSASSGKLLTYILPCFPPLAMLLGAGLDSYLSSSQRRALKVGAGLLAAMFASILMYFIFAQRDPSSAANFTDGETTRLLWLITLFGAGLCAALLSVLTRRTWLAVSGVALSGIMLFGPVQLGMLPQQVMGSRMPEDFLLSNLEVDSDTILVSDASLAGAVAWSFKRDDVYVVSPGELGYGLSYPDSRDRLLDPAALADLVAANRAKHHIVVICRDYAVANLPTVLTKDANRIDYYKIATLSL